MSLGLWVPGVQWPATVELWTDVKKAKSLCVSGVWSKQSQYEFIFDQYSLGSEQCLCAASKYFINFLNGLWGNLMSHKLNFALSTEWSLRELSVIFGVGLPARGDKACCF